MGDKNAESYRRDLLGERRSMERPTRRSNISAREPSLEERRRGARRRSDTLADAEGPDAVDAARTPSSR
jgi:hypothetical protein